MHHTEDVPETVQGLPNLCGHDEFSSRPKQNAGGSDSAVNFDQINSCFANALHMHQPLIPAGGDDLRTAEVISNLQAMMDHPDIGDNHNDPVFHWCY